MNLKANSELRIKMVQNKIAIWQLAVQLNCHERTVIRHLRNGDRVRLKDFGLLELEIESEKVDNLKDFKAKKHIRGVRLHFLPTSENGSQALYEGIDYEKDKNFAEE